MFRDATELSVPVDSGVIVPTPRSGHVEAPRLPQGTLDIQSPPDVVESEGLGGTIAMAVPMIGSMGVLVFMAFSNNANPRMMLMAGAMIIAMVAMVGFTSYRQISQHRQKVTTQRREYLVYLDELRDDVRHAARDQRRFTTWNMPDPPSLSAIIQQNERLWERTDPSALTYMTRVGTADEPLCLELREPELAPLSNADPVCLSAVSRFVSTFDTVHDLPAGISIADYARIEVAGAPEHTRALARSMALSLSTFISPKLLRVAVVADAEGLADWDWVKWLPHARSAESDAVGTMRLMGGSVAEVLDLLPFDVSSRARFRQRTSETAMPQLLLILDGVELRASDRERLAKEGVCVLSVVEEWSRLEDYESLRIALQPRSDGRMNTTLVTLVGENTGIVADSMSAELALATARRLTPYEEGTRRSAVTPNASGASSDPTRQEDLMELLGLGDIRDYDPDMQIVRRQGGARLNIPFAVTPEGVPVHLDIKENAQQGMGPHGLLIGATGSGKSEVLRTMVLGMVLTHSPEQLNLVLVDFKGGATFAGMSELPHVSATITNLESELYLVDRMEEALHGEMVRRQELLRAAGNYANVGDYEKARLAGQHQHPALPALFIILDEFSELLTAKPEFIDTFVAIGRLGRSLEIHLLLATQKLEESRLRGLDSHLSYRIGLRTFSQADSRAVLGKTDAYSLPAVPGVGFLKTSGDEMTQFRASYVAAPPPARRAEAMSATGGPVRSASRLLPFTASPVLSLEDQRDSEETESEDASNTEPVVKDGDDQWADMSTLDIAVRKLEPLQPRAHQVWLDPLEVPATLDELFGDLTVTEADGLHSPSWKGKGGLTVPMGMKDIPREQRREVLSMDLTGGAGNVAIIGSAQSGKSTALRTLVMSLSLVNTPAEAQFYILDFGGGTFAPFRHAPHVAGVGSRDRLDIITRMIQEIAGIMEDREAYFREHDIDSIATYRRGRAAGRYDDGYGDVYLVVDGWGTLKSDVPDLDRTIQDLMGRGLALGVHLLAAATRLGEFRIAMQSTFGTLFELRLGEPRESEIDRKKAASVPEGRPGHGLAASKHQSLVALPRVDGASDATSLPDGIKHAFTAIEQAWSGPAGPKLRLLPQRITLDEVRELAPEAPNALLGINEARLSPVALNFSKISHLYAFGDSGTGKSTLLRTVIQEVARTHDAKKAQFLVVDYRRSLLQEIPPRYQAGYYTTHDVVTGAMKEIHGILAGRLPGPDVTPQQLRDRSWWEGPDLFIIIDDYDLVATSRGNPLEPLVPLLAQARDIGMHVIVTRRTGGASRAQYDPLLRGMIDIGTPALLLPGDPEEGPLVGKIRSQRGPAGRAQFITRELGHQMVQLAESETLVDLSDA
ncbi:type VII secretion protein EccCa [Citricoccus sp. NR2]|uniref:type VII secretion protein EccCa n=1 Tax=Citricoccus sp. NR2 TaxID=3004095 RepID=UPI0022DE2737|nr:type VII secretion protein EccCa [Citricoccus sp. NR2]WBL19691.1 type VII secretion protein EccCa [Citricoccus sp. NR2]